MELTILLIAAGIIANTFASVVVFRVPLLTTSQRLLQLSFIWLVPLIGAIICTVYAYAQAPSTTKTGIADAVYLDSDLTAFSDSSACGGDASGGGDGE